MKYKIKVTYFTPSGKYYTTGDYETDLDVMYKVFDEVKTMALNGNIPGLSKDAMWSSYPNENDWILHVDSDNHPNAYPGIIRLGRDATGKRIVL